MMSVAEDLMEVGVPVGSIRPSPRAVSHARLCDVALRATVRASSLDDTERHALYAWLRAWKHHWPSSFRRLLGPAGATLLRRAAPRTLDANRYLKLRRIAIANLAALL